MEIGALNESSLHNKLKHIIAGNLKETEFFLDGYYIDVFKNNVIYEVQTKNLKKMSKKIKALTTSYPFVIVHPLYYKKTLVKYSKDGNLISRRKSPRSENEFYLFYELVYCYNFFNIENLSIQLYLLDIDEIRIDNQKGSYKRKGVEIVDRKINSIIDVITIRNKNDLTKMIALPDNNISTNSLAKQLNITKPLSRKIIYCLKNLNIIESCNKTGNLVIYKKII